MNKIAIANFVEKYLIQMVNTVFAVVTNPKEALDFFYERLYFAYSSDKNQLTINIKKLENLYQNQNEFKINMVLRITRPMVKINYLLHGDKRVLELIDLGLIDINNYENVKPIILLVDDILSRFIKDIYMFKKNVSNNLDEITEYINYEISKLNEYVKNMS